MGLTGKYDFPGIKSKGAQALELLISSAWAPFGAALKIPVIGSMIDGLIQILVNYLANQGLVILNIGAIIVEGEFDQSGFDSAMDAALKSVGANPNGLTDQQKKAIDDKVIQAFKKFADLGATINS